MQDALSRLSQHRTVLIVAHRLSTVMHADNIIVMDCGEIVEQGTHSDLLARRGSYFHLWESQYREQSDQFF